MDSSAGRWLEVIKLSLLIGLSIVNGFLLDYNREQVDKIESLQDSVDQVAPGL